MPLPRLPVGTHIRDEERIILADLVAARYNGGASIRAIAAELGRSYGFAHRLLDEHPDVVLRDRSGKKKPRPRRRRRRS